MSEETKTKEVNFKEKYFHQMKRCDKLESELKEVRQLLTSLYPIINRKILKHTIKQYSMVG